MDQRSRYCACSFMQNIILIGGSNCDKDVKSCMAYDCKSNKWTDIASMNEIRGHTSSTVFKGKLWLLGVG